MNDRVHALHVDAVGSHQPFDHLEETRLDGTQLCSGHIRKLHHLYEERAIYVLDIKRLTRVERRENYSDDKSKKQEDKKSKDFGIKKIFQK